MAKLPKRKIKFAQSTKNPQKVLIKIHRDRSGGKLLKINKETNKHETNESNMAKAN